ncbi:MAG: prolipoprotein diacylglyceryl transferase [Clostridia bacterium]|nr:prolipoprotein diacylglyceryl transferase [Clostridia bacterium]
MYPHKIFGLFYLYGLMIALGLLAAFGILFYYGKKKKVEEKFIDFIFYNGIISIAVGFGAAALFQATYDYIENPENGFHFNGGITFIGGLIGGVICFLAIYFLLRKRYKTRLTDTLSMFPCAILIGHAFGRIGCFFAGCCYGKETDSFLGVQFPHLSSPVHPTQLYEAAFLFIMFAICFYLLMKKDFKHNLSLYLVSYGIFRFLIEYLRADDRGQFVAGISPSQFWSILMVVAGVALFFAIRYLEKRKKLKENDRVEVIETIETVEETVKENEE